MGHNSSPITVFTFLEVKFLKTHKAVLSGYVRGLERRRRREGPERGAEEDEEGRVASSRR